jgi:hypothetical protein
MGFLNFLNSFEGSITVLVVMTILTILLVVFYKLVKARELLVNSMRIIDDKNKEIKALNSSHESVLKGTELKSNLATHTKLKEKLIDKLQLCETSSDLDIVFYVSTLLKTNSEEDSKKMTIKDDWITELSKGNTATTLEKISSYLKINNNERGLYEITGYSNRLNSMTGLLHKGVVKLDEYNLENSKINSAILEFIRRV